MNMTKTLIRLYLYRKKSHSGKYRVRKKTGMMKKKQMSIFNSDICLASLPAHSPQQCLQCVQHAHTYATVTFLSHVGSGSVAETNTGFLKKILKLFWINEDACKHVLCVCVFRGYMWVQLPMESKVAGVTGDCRLPRKGVKTQTWVLCKTSTYSLPLSLQPYAGWFDEYIIFTRIICKEVYSSPRNAWCATTNTQVWIAFSKELKKSSKCPLGLESSHFPSSNLLAPFILRPSGHFICSPDENGFRADTDKLTSRDPGHMGHYSASWQVTCLPCGFYF